MRRLMPSTTSDAGRQTVVRVPIFSSVAYHERARITRAPRDLKAPERSAPDFNRTTTAVQCSVLTEKQFTVLVGSLNGKELLLNTFTIHASDADSFDERRSGISTPTHAVEGEFKRGRQIVWVRGCSRGGDTHARQHELHLLYKVVPVPPASTVRPGEGGVTRTTA